jgi:hypothetical protein
MLLLEVNLLQIVFNRAAGHLCSHLAVANPVRWSRFTLDEIFRADSQ